MVDLHTHALFGMDDGAQTIEDSIDILKRAKTAGVKKMALTPHFSIGEDTDEFLGKRERHFFMLEKACGDKNIDIELCLGAEVYVTDELYNEESLGKLAIGESNTILTEFKYYGIRREKFVNYIDEILSHKVNILLAHVERYAYVRNDKWLLDRILERGIMLQVNAVSLFEDSEEGEFARMIVKNNLAFNIASDVHSINSRRLGAMERLNESGMWKNILYTNPKEIFDKRG